MAFGPCEYCGYSECECGMAAVPTWISTRDSLPDEGTPVLWHDPDAKAWQTFVGQRDGKSINHGGDLNMPIPKRAFWMELPEAPRVRKLKSLPVDEAHHPR